MSTAYYAAIASTAASHPVSGITVMAITAGLVVLGLMLRSSFRSWRGERNHPANAPIWPVAKKHGSREVSR